MRNAIHVKLEVHAIAEMGLICILSILLLSACSKWGSNEIAAGELGTVLVADGFEKPLFVTSPRSDTSRLFVVEQVGTIRIVENGEVLNAAFLDIEDEVGYGGERGLLCLAFHPDYSSNGYFYVDYTNKRGDTRIYRFSVSDDPNRADRASETVLLAIDQPYSNHNGGMLAFGPDGYLYIGMGDGGSAGDPENRAQNGQVLLGKLLRIDVDHGSPYAIPATNPFVESDEFRKEIWAYGLRNPWRFSFDRETGELYIADVGQDKWEEIDFQPASDKGGEDYGWRLKEGNHCYQPSTNCEREGLIDPIHEYSHDDGCSISGGYVYRGCDIPSLRGTYFFADYCSAKVWAMRRDNTGAPIVVDITDDLDPGNGRSIGDIPSFGEDANGELYILDLKDGEVFKITSNDTLDSSGNRIAPR